MLLPALSKAREKARSISCVNKLKQLGTMELMYAGDNNDFISSNTRKVGDKIGVQEYGCSGVMNLTASAGLLSRYVGATYTSTALTDANFVAYKKQYFTCPSDSYYVGYNAGYSSYCSYKWDDVGAAASSGVSRYTSNGNIRVGTHDPNRTIWFDMIWPVMGANTYPDNHDGSANVLKLGGHVVSKKYNKNVAVATNFAHDIFLGVFDELPLK